MKNKIVSDPYKTVLTICIGFAGIYFLVDQVWPLYVVLSVGVLGLLSPWIAKKIEWLWFGIAQILSYIAPNVLLTLVFYVALFPMAMIAKVFKKSDALKLKNKYDSMYVVAEQEFDKASFERPF